MSLCWQIPPQPSFSTYLWTSFVTHTPQPTTLRLPPLPPPLQYYVDYRRWRRCWRRHTTFASSSRLPRILGLSAARPVRQTLFSNNQPRRQNVCEDYSDGTIRDDVRCVCVCLTWECAIFVVALLFFNKYVYTIVWASVSKYTDVWSSRLNSITISSLG